jgi:Flp pilus assembly protein TadD
MQPLLVLTRIDVLQAGDVVPPGHAHAKVHSDGTLQGRQHRAGAAGSTGQAQQAVQCVYIHWDAQNLLGCCQVKQGRQCQAVIGSRQSRALTVNRPHGTTECCVDT